jgi:hypothetical protein
MNITNTHEQQLSTDDILKETKYLYIKKKELKLIRQKENHLQNSHQGEQTLWQDITET